MNWPPIDWIHLLKKSLLVTVRIPAQKIDTQTAFSNHKHRPDIEKKHSLSCSEFVVENTFSPTQTSQITKKIQLEKGKKRVKKREISKSVKVVEFVQWMNEWMNNIFIREHDFRDQLVI